MFPSSKYSSKHYNFSFLISNLCTGGQFSYLWNVIGVRNYQNSELVLGFSLFPFASLNFTSKFLFGHPLVNLLPQFDSFEPSSALFSRL
jgi:hypothetical protein